MGLSEKPCEELRGEEGQTATEDDAADLPLGTALPEHEHQAADNYGDEGEGSRERSREGLFEIAGSALPR